MWKIVILSVLIAGIRGSGTGNFEIKGIVLEESKCLSDLLKIFEGFNRTEIWAMKILDASTKFPSGLLTGHLTDYGNYDECVYNKGSNLTTQHCFARFTFNGGRFPANVSLKFSYCVPASCSPGELENILRDFLKGVDLNVTVNPNECVRANWKSISPEDYVGIVIWGLFIGAAVLSTIYDVSCRMVFDVETKPLLSSFSLYDNTKRLLNANVHSDTLMPLHGLKFLSICWIILGHRYFFSVFSSLLNYNELLTVMNEIQAQVFVQGVLAVDTFFLLSGLLNCYHLLMVLDKSKRFPFTKYYLHRYLRLTPALAAVVLMYATWYVLIGDGPNWIQTTQIWKNFCIENWWPTLLYINNYYNPISQCAGQSWYLAVDMQLYWLSPFLILPLWKKPRIGKIIIGFLFIVSVAIVFAIAFIYKFRASFDAGFENFDLYLTSTELLYVPTHARATPYIIGLMLGYYLHFLRKNKAVLVLSKGLLFSGWLIISITFVSVIFGNYQFVRPIADHPYDRLESSFYISLHRIGWGLGISWIIVCCVNKMGGIVNEILSWKGFVPLSRLTYCMFLCHMAVQQYNVGTARTSDYVQFFNQMHRYAGDLFFSVTFAAFLYLVFESPAIRLEKLFGAKGIKEKNNIRGNLNRGFEGEHEGKRTQVFSA